MPNPTNATTSIAVDSPTITSIGSGYTRGTRIADPITGPTPHAVEVNR